MGLLRGLTWVCCITLRAHFLFPPVLLDLGFDDWEVPKWFQEHSYQTFPPTATRRIFWSHTERAERGTPGPPEVGDGALPEGHPDDVILEVSGSSSQDRCFPRDPAVAPQKVRLDPPGTHPSSTYSAGSLGLLRASQTHHPHAPNAPVAALADQRHRLLQRSTRQVASNGLGGHLIWAIVGPKEALQWPRCYKCSNCSVCVAS